VSRRRVARRFADAAGRAFGLLPRAWRFGAARRIAVLLAPLFRRSPFYAGRPSLLDGAREECLRMMLRTMTRTGVRFAPEVDVRGAELVPPGGALIVSGHFLLNILLSRWLEDRGHPFTAVVGGPREPMFVSGTPQQLDLIQRKSDVLLAIRGRMARGRKVLLDVDQRIPQEDWPVVDTAAGRLHVSPVAFRFAERVRTPVLFAATRFDGRRVMMTFARPSGDDAQTMRDDFCAFLRAEVAAIRR
jgi:hypothetical protein